MVAAKVVIGANLGDEGKGLITDYLTNKHQAGLVVRFNGGAQAGHTVTLPDGTRHVFSHIGSGTFAGAATYLSRFFVVNPLLFFKELERMPITIPLPQISEKIFIDPRCPVTTPYDMMINQMLENRRGDGRHGSCGVGFGETIQRQYHSGHSITFDMLGNIHDLKKRMAAIRAEWFPMRCAQLELDPLDKFASLLNDNLFQKFILDAARMHAAVTCADQSKIHEFETVVFEGAQGLLLDQSHSNFPHVTRSNTGLKNVLSICEDAGIPDLDVTYCTRAYLTRHGSGPMQNEMARLPFASVVDKTNIPNTFQGTLRFAPLDVQLLRETVQDDLKHANVSYVQIRGAGLSVSCMDQLGRRPYIHHGSAMEVFESTDNDSMAARISGTVFGGYEGCVNPVIRSYGPSRDYVIQNGR